MPYHEQGNVRSVWLLAQLRPNGYTSAKKNLERQKFNVFAPMQELEKGVGAKAQKTLLPLFPGYMFVSVQNESKPWRAINSTYGVSRLVNLGSNAPNIVPDSFISGLMARCDENGILLPFSDLSAGDKIKIISGPFSKMLSLVEDIDDNNRIWVLLEILGRKTKVAIDSKNVFKL